MAISKDSATFCLNITNIPFATTLDQLKEAFPTAENVVMRCRKDGVFKGYVRYFYTMNLASLFYYFYFKFISRLGVFFAAKEFNVPLEKSVLLNHNPTLIAQPMH